MLFSLLIVCALLTTSVNAELSISVVGRYGGGAEVFDESAAEIVVFDATSGLLLVSNAFTNAIDVLDISDPTTPTLVKALNNTGLGPNSVAVYDGLAAVALEANVKQEPGSVAFYDLTTDSGTFLGMVEVGALPDMLTFTPDGSMVVVACEGEPNDDYDVDPEGSVAVIDTSSGYTDSMEVTIINFHAYDGQEDSLRADGVRIFGPNATASQDFEPEYIVVSEDSMTAVVVLQENNAFAHIDLETKTIVEIKPLGFKNHTAAGNKFDASNRDGGINITSWPTLGMYQPDGMTGFVIDDNQYYVTANEGDSRDYDGYSEEGRVKDLTLDQSFFDLNIDIQESEYLGRLKTTFANGDEDGDGIYETVYSYGARSFSIFDADLNMVYDSGSILEDETAAIIPDGFNSNNDENNSMDSRSDDKGPEPEAVVYADIEGSSYLFVMLERVSGIAVFTVDDPTQPAFEQYVHSRLFDGVAEDGTAGDLGPESGVFIPAADSPTDDALLVVANEVSGTTTIYKLEIPSNDETSGGSRITMVLGPIVFGLIAMVSVLGY